MDITELVVACWPKNLKKLYLKMEKYQKKKLKYGRETDLLSIRSDMYNQPNKYAQLIPDTYYSNLSNEESIKGIIKQFHLCRYPCP